VYCGRPDCQTPGVASPTQPKPKGANVTQNPWPPVADRAPGVAPGMLLPPVEVPRDRWGRPKIDGRAYTRVSTLAKTLDDTRALMLWQARQTALGVALSPDLIAAVATTDPTDKRALDGIVSQALERAKTKAGATLGTAIHRATELADRGEPINGLPENVRGPAEAYRATMAGLGLTPLAAEVFVTAHDVNAAGTFDRLLKGPNRTLIGDLKTSENADTAKWAGTAWAIQLATYAHGKPWTPEKGHCEWSDLGLPVPDQERGLIIHIQPSTGKVRLYSVDLVGGWIAAKLADEVRAMTKFNYTTEIA
jgi:hypothetical protein